MDLKNTSQKSSHPASTLASHQETNATRPLYGVLMLHGPNISASNVNFVRDTLDNNHLPSIEIGNGIKQIFMEKPVATDAVGIRKVLAAAEEAKRKKLNVVVGLQRHYQTVYRQWVDRLQTTAAASD